MSLGLNPWSCQLHLEDVKFKQAHLGERTLKSFRNTGTVEMQCLVITINCITSVGSVSRHLDRSSGSVCGCALLAERVCVSPVCVPARELVATSGGEECLCLCRSVSSALARPVYVSSVGPSIGASPKKRVSATD